MITPLLVIVLLLVLTAEFVNGWTDAPNSIATVVATKVLPAKFAIFMAAVLNVIGTLAGTAVAETIGKDIIDPSIINLKTIAAAVLGVILWGSLAARIGIPTSESHALVAGLSGAGLATAGPEVLIWAGWQKVIIGLLFSSFIGFIGGYIVAKLILVSCRNLPPAHAHRAFKALQVLSAAGMAFNHGLNDGQKFMGVFTVALVLGGVLTSFQIPFWVIIICALVMGIGTSIGGRKIIEKLGMKMVHIEPWQGFSAEANASGIILVASSFGIPLSTTQSITTSIMGVAAARRMGSVRLRVVREIVLAWVITFPFCGALAFIAATLFKLI